MFFASFLQDEEFDYTFTSLKIQLRVRNAEI